MGHPGDAMNESGHPRVRFAEFEADFETGCLLRSGRPVAIQRQPFEALKRLLMARGRLVTRAEFQRSLWPDAIHVDFERGLTSAMHKVREALEDSGRTPRLVETLPGRGYRITCSVEFTDDVISAPVLQRWQPPPAAALLLGLVLGISTGGPWLQRPARDRAPSLDAALSDAHAAEARMDLLAHEVPGAAALAGEIRMLSLRALGRDPRSARARIVLARLELREGSLAAAAELAEGVVADHPDFAPAYLTLASVRKQQDRPAEAASLANTALSLAPDDAMTMALAGFYAHPIGQYDREWQLLEQAARTDPTSSDVLWHLALGQARRSEFAPARRTLERALMLSPGSPRLLYWRGYVEAEAGQIVQARHTLQTLSRLLGGSTSGNRVLASLDWIIQAKGTGRS